MKAMLAVLECPLGFLRLPCGFLESCCCYEQLLKQEREQSCHASISLGPAGISDQEAYLFPPKTPPLSRSLLVEILDLPWPIQSLSLVSQPCHQPTQESTAHSGQSPETSQSQPIFGGQEMK